jgi:alcohol dehydrogenase
MDISFKLDPEIITGPDTISRAGTVCGSYGSRAFIVTEQGLNQKQGLERLKGILEDSRVEAIVFDEVPAQAAADAAEAAAGLCRGARCSVVIGFGGLNVQTIARMTASMSSPDISAFDLLDGQRPGADFLPYIAIPTASGDPFLFSGYCVTVDPRDRSVKQLKLPDKLCSAAIIDSGIAESPAGTFSAAAFGGFCVAVEAYCSARANLFSDALLEQAIALYARIIKSNPDSAEFDAAAASTGAGFLSALGSAVSAPGIGTALSYALNGRFPLAKHRCSTVILPYIMEKLIAVRPEKIARVAALMGEAPEGSPVSEAANLALESVRRRMDELKVPMHLNEFNLSLDRLAAVAESARNLEFVAFSPWTVSSEDAFGILKQAM